MGIQSGCLLIADIGGYTRYLSGVELDHSQDILADLIGSVVGCLRGGGFTLAKLEGDAVFCYAADGADADGGRLVTMVEGTYFAFQSRLRDIGFATNCTCDACRMIPTLDLKLLIHQGQYIRHEVVGTAELLGPDVILAHRLLKNTVALEFGLSGYALFTRACVDRFAIDWRAAGMREHGENYEDAGAVDAYLLDLERRWQEEQGRAAVYLEPGGAIFDWSAVVEAPPPLVWEYFTSPSKRARWQLNTERVDQANPQGVPGMGTTNHCVHGDGSVVTESIVDWKPFRYLSFRAETGMGPVLVTAEFTPSEDGSATTLGYRLQPLAAETDARPMTPDDIASFLQTFMDAGVANMRTMIATDAAAGA